MATKKWAFRTLTGGAAGSLDSLPVAGLTNLDTANGIVNGLYHPYYYDASSTESEASPYVIIPDDNVSGTGAWVLSGFQGMKTEIFANTSAGQSIATGSETNIVYDNIIKDALGELSGATFTPIYDGNYTISFTHTYTSTSVWVLGNPFYSFLYINTDQTDRGDDRIELSGTYRLRGPLLFGSFPLTGGVPVTFRCQQSETGARTLQTVAIMNTLTIVRNF